MSPAIAILLLILAANTAVGIGVFFTNTKRSQNRLFLLFSLSLSLWVIFVLSIIKSTTALSAGIGIRGASIAGASIPVTFYLFCQGIASPELSFIGLCKKSKLILWLSAIIGLMCTTNIFLYDVTMPTVENGLTVPDAHYRFGFVLFISFFPVVIYRTIYVFYKTLRSSYGMARTEMQFTLTGMASALPLAVIIHVFAIVSGSSQPQQYGPLCIIPMNVVIAYGIATRRILGIERIFRQAIAYSLLATVLALVYYVSFKALVYLLSEVMTDPSIIAQITATIIALLVMPPAQHNIHAATNKLISGNSVDVASTMKRASEVFQSVSTIDSLISYFSLLMTDALKSKSASVLLYDDNVFTQANRTHSPELKLANDSAIIEMLKKTKDTICIDTLGRSRETALTRKVLDEMSDLGIAAATGMFSKGGLTGILLNGPKKNNRIYDKAEQEAIQILCNQFAVALENAQMYTEMQDSKIRNEIMLDQLVSGVILADTEHRITLFNHEAQRITGISESDAMGRSIEVLPPPVCRALEMALDNELGERIIEARLFEQDESKKSLSIRMGTTFLLGHDQKPMGALLVFTDMTELKSLEEQVRRSDQLSSVGTLAAGMAHEIKNPLVTIKTFTQLLPQRYADEDFRHDFSALVAHEVARIDGIVNELLSFSKPTKPHLVPMRLHDTIDQILKLTHEQMLQKKIAIKDKCYAAIDYIQGDAKLLSQALINLTLNAIEAIGNDGTITVGTTNCSYRFANGEGPDNAITRQCIRIQISDTGQGIPRESLQKIFDPFFTSKSEGTGMGLSVAHGIIQEHHGAMDVESEVGIGSTFYIYLPIIEQEAA